MIKDEKRTEQKIIRKNRKEQKKKNRNKGKNWLSESAGKETFPNITGYINFFSTKTSSFGQSTKTCLLVSSLGKSEHF